MHGGAEMIRPLCLIRVSSTVTVPTHGTPFDLMAKTALLTFSTD